MSGTITSVLAITLAATLLAFTLIWLISLWLKDASIVDMYWGPGFAVIAALAGLMAGIKNTFQVILMACIFAWALRLSVHILRRHRGEDARYAAMRAGHRDNFAVWRLVVIFWLQAVIQWLASTPALVAMLAPPVHVPWLFGLGLSLFCAGFGLEWLADRAVARHRADPANKGKLITAGLHAHVRHPNYLGEIMLQWGLGVMSLGLTLNVLALLGPALMMFLIVKVSGVPLLEAEFAKRPGYAAWAARTNALWPRF
jgi:steroid 5-alpha reductase family enzyme